MNADGDTGAAATGGWVAGPGGNSSSPLRPHAASESATKAVAASTSVRPIPLIPAKAGTQRWIPAFAGMSGNIRRTPAKGLSPTRAQSHHSKPDRGGDIVSGTSCQGIYQAVTAGFLTAFARVL